MSRLLLPIATSASAWILTMWISSRRSTSEGTQTIQGILSGGRNKSRKDSWLKRQVRMRSISGSGNSRDSSIDTSNSLEDQHPPSEMEWRIGDNGRLIPLQLRKVQTATGRMVVLRQRVELEHLSDHQLLLGLLSVMGKTAPLERFERLERRVRTLSRSSASMRDEVVRISQLYSGITTARLRRTLQTQPRISARPSLAICRSTSARQKRITPETDFNRRHRRLTKPKGQCYRGSRRK